MAARHRDDIGPPSLLTPPAAGRDPGELWAADERDVHRSGDGGRSWERIAAFPVTPAWLRGIAITSDRRPS